MADQAHSKKALAGPMVANLVLGALLSAFIIGCGPVDQTTTTEAVEVLETRLESDGGEQSPTTTSSIDTTDEQESPVFNRPQPAPGRPCVPIRPCVE